MMHINRLAAAHWNICWKALLSLVFSFVIAPVIWGQGTSELSIELNSAGQVKILARSVTYAQVLKALQEKLSVVIEIPALAEELKINEVRVEANSPSDALEKLLAGSGLDFAILKSEDGTRIAKVVVTATAPPESSRTTAQVPTSDSPASSTPEVSSDAAAANANAESPSAEEEQGPKPPKAQVQALSAAASVIGTQTDGSVEEAVAPTEYPLPPSLQMHEGETPPPAVTMPLSEAAQAMGAPPNVPPEEVGQTKILPLPPPGQKRP